MLNHGDYLDFTVGIAPQPSNGSHALDIQNTTGDGWNLFRTAALATGASLAVSRHASSSGQQPTTNTKSVSATTTQPLNVSRVFVRIKRSRTQETTALFLSMAAQSTTNRSNSRAVISPVEGTTTQMVDWQIEQSC